MTNSVQQKVSLTVSVDPDTRHLLAKHGGQRHIGILIARMVRNYDAEEAFGFQAIRQRLDRIEHCLIDISEIKEVRSEK
jgi:hypothetical protein